jgi:uncharacterized protein YcaQ
MERRKARTLQKRIAKQQELLSKEGRELSSKSFACIPDAERALGDLQDKASKLGFATERGVETVVNLSYPHKGRPRKGVSRDMQIMSYRVTPKWMWMD